MNRILTVVFSMCALLVAAQSTYPGRAFKDLEVTNSITKSFGDSVYHFSIKLIDDDLRDRDVAKRYYWFHQGEVKNTVGSYSGRVLHGKFEKFDREGNLLEQGSFSQGLKDDRWMGWFKNGNAAYNHHWKKGDRHGVFEEYYDNGSLKKRGRFKDGMLHRKVSAYSREGTLVSVEKYKYGKLKAAKPFKLSLKRKAPKVKESEPASTSPPATEEKQRRKKKPKKEHEAGPIVP